MFSPYYHHARRRRDADPANHVAMNVALYGRNAAWAMTERGRTALARTPATLRIGPSQMRWQQDNTLRIDIDEITVPIPRRLRGQIILDPTILLDTPYNLDTACRHRWTPIAPAARVHLSFEHPALDWSGHAYLDSNDGDAPLEDAFTHWTWSRAALPDGSAAVIYDATRIDGSLHRIARRFTQDGAVTQFQPPPNHPLPRSAWGMRGEAPGEARAPGLLRRLENGPFYTRSILATRLFGDDVAAIHETLSLTRFRAPWVRALLPFRMPRRAGRQAADASGAEPSKDVT